MATFNKQKKNPYLHFLMRLGIFAATVFVLDLAAGTLLRHYYFKQQSGPLYQTTYSMETATPDIMIFGSSRANHHYVPEVFEEELGMSYYNAGKDGNQIHYHYAVLESVLKRYTPKIIILDVASKDIIKFDESYDRLSSLLPYYKTHPEIRPMANLKSRFEKYKLVSASYPFNSIMLNILKGNSNARDEKNDKGYIPLNKIWTAPLAADPYQQPEEIDSLKLQYFEKFIETCKNAGVKLYVAFSPIYIRYDQPPVALQVVGEICRKYEVPFYDYSKDQEFLSNPSLFSDRSHLNGKGAAVYSEKIAKEIKKSLQAPTRP